MSNAVSNEVIGPANSWMLLFVASILGFPLISIIPVMLDVASTPISIAFRVAVLCLALSTLGKWCFGQGRLRADWSVAALVLFWAILLGRVVWDATIVPRPLHLDWAGHFAFAIGVSFVPALALLVLPSQIALERTRTVAEVIGVTALAALALLGVAHASLDETLFRLATLVLNASSLGHLAVTVMVFSICGLLWGRAGDSGLRRTFLFILRCSSVALAVVVLIATASKGPMIAALAVLFTLMLVSMQRSGLSVSRPILGLAGLTLVVGGGVWVAQWLESATQFRSVSRVTDSFVDASTSERLQLIRGALAQFSEHPILGDNLVELSLRFYPHNVLVEALMSTGVLGFVLFMVPLLVSLVVVWRLLTRTRGLEWLALVHIQSCLAAILAGSLVFGPQYWATLSATLAVGALIHAESAAPLTR